MSASAALYADIGGTNIRFAVGVDRQVVAPRSYRCADFADAGAAARRYLEDLRSSMRPETALLAIAAPVDAPVIAMTNHPWTIDLKALGGALGINRVVAINDVAAVALSLDRLASHDLMPIVEGEAREAAARVVIGLGTGLGVAAVLNDVTGARAIATEAGHMTLAARDDEEASILSVLRARFGHVSGERVLAGPGLVNLYQALAASAQSGAMMTAETILARAAEGDATGLRALDRHGAFLGALAGDLVLAFNAWGGVYLAGSLATALAERLAGGGFREAFGAKGRHADRLSRVGVHVIAHPTPAFVGLDSWWRAGLKPAQPAISVTMA
jgi:glucokinase